MVNQMKGSLPINQIVCGDCCEVMQTFPKESVDLVMFSPPYWGLRDYGEETATVWGGKKDCEHEWQEEKHKFHGGTKAGEKQLTNRGSFHNDFIGQHGFCVKCGAWKGQLGLEPHPSMYIDHMVTVCSAVKRVLKKSGSLYLNVGDTYCGSHAGYGDYRHANKRGISNVELYNTIEKPQSKFKDKDGWLQPKQKLMMPSRLAIALQHEGWILRNDIIWHKPNHMPSSVRDRLTNAYEHIFHFVKARRYFYDLDAIRQPHKISSIKRVNQDLEVQHGGPKEQAYLNENIIPAGGDVKQISKIIKRLKRNIQEGKGKNPGDVLEAQPYSIQPRLKEFVEYRHLPSLKEVKDYLNLWRKKRGFTIEQVEQRLDSQAPHHWFNGESYPTKEDWLRIKELLKFDDRYDKQMTEAFIKPSAKQNNPLGKNPSDIVLERGYKGGRIEVDGEWLNDICPHCGRTMRRHYGVQSGKTRFIPCDGKGKNPSDCIHGKFSIGDGYRQGMNRDETAFSVQLKNPPNPSQLVDYLRNWKGKLTARQIDEKLGYHGDCASHWFTYPDSKHGFAYPSPTDWIRLKAILGFDNRFDVAMTETILVSQQVQPSPRGKNPSDFWSINSSYGIHLTPKENKYLAKLWNKFIDDHGTDEQDACIVDIGYLFDCITKTLEVTSHSPSDFWSINTKPFPQAHFAVYPEAICEMPIKSSCPENGIVLDPMCGAGTTLVVAQKLGRQWIGIDLKPEYVEMAKQRLMRECSQKLVKWT